MINSDQHLDQASVYTDFNGLANLKNKASGDARSALRDVAEQFETIFMNMMLKSMRDANAVFKGEGSLNSREVEFYQNMYDQQLTTNISNGRGIGIADMLVKQLEKYVPATAADLEALRERREENGASAGVPLDRARLQTTSKTEGSDNREQEWNAERFAQLNRDASENERFDSLESFVKSLYPLAEMVAKRFNLEPKLMVAQAALETGWGKHMMSENGQPSFNLFGIKADKRWQGDVVQANTKEFEHGQFTQEQANFRAYNSYGESMLDYGEFLQDNPRYQNALRLGRSPEFFVEQLQDAGYATDPDYAEKILSILKGNSLNAALAGEP